MTDALLSLLNPPAVYWSVAALTLLITGAMALGLDIWCVRRIRPDPVVPAPSKKQRKRDAQRSDESETQDPPAPDASQTDRWRIGLFLSLCFLTLFAFRWPGIVQQTFLNEDEAQMLAQAMTFASDPTPWRAVDTTTSGPLNSYVLLLFAPLGWEPSLPVARFVGLLCVLSTLAGLVLACRRAGGSVTASRAAALPLLVFYALAIDPEFVHYSSEHLPNALLALAWAGVVGFAGSVTPGGVFATGALLGLVPFAKLQAALIAVGLALFGGGVLLLKIRSEPSKPWRVLLSYAAGGLAPAVILLGWTAAAGAWTDFWKSYIELGLLHSVQSGAAWTQSRSSSLGWLATALTQSPHLTPLTLTSALLLTGGAATVIRQGTRPSPHLMTFLAATCFYLLIAAYCVIKPGFNYPHYLLLLIPPVAGLGAVGSLACAEGLRSTEPLARSTAQTALILAALALLSLTSLWRLPLGNPFAGTWPANRQPVDSIIGQVIRAVAPDPADRRIALWGWAARYVVEARGQLGTRDAISQFQIKSGFFNDAEAHDRRDYYRKRYLADLATHQPAVFLDAVAPGHIYFIDRSKFGHETFPELVGYLKMRYTLMAEVGGIRIFARNDLVPAAQTRLQDLARR